MAANYGTLASSFMTISVNGSDLMGLATGITYSTSNEMTGVAFGVGELATSNVLYQKPFAWVIAFDTFDITGYGSTPDVNFNLSQLNGDGTSQIILSKNRPQVSGIADRDFDAGTIIFSGCGAGVQSGSVSVSSPVINNFTINALDAAFR